MPDPPEQRGPFAVEPSDEGAALSAVVRKATGLPWSAAKRLIARGVVLVDGRVVTHAGHRVRAGQTVELRASAAPSPTSLVLEREAIRYVDAHVVVVEKPAGISTVPFEEGERGTLVDRVRITLSRRGMAAPNAPLFVVHRLDKETSGLLVFGRTWVAKRHLASLFRRHEVERVYLALVHGVLARDKVTFDTFLVENRGDGLRGSAKQPGLGVRAVTHVRVLARLRGATLVRCQLETGRTHQIRIHLAEAGHPLVGERVYSRHFAGPLIEAPRLMLHAATLGFTHPTEPGRLLRFTSELPEDFRTVALGLGAREQDLKIE